MSYLKTLPSLIILLTLFVSISSCTYDNEKDLFEKPVCEDISDVKLTSDIKSVLEANCYICHASAVSTGGIDLEDYESLQALALSGKLYGSISHENGFSAMPPSGEMLDKCYIELMKTWIEEGAKNN